MAAFVAPLIGAGASLLSGIFGQKQQKTTTTGSSSVNPNLDPQQAFLQNLIGNDAVNQSREDPDLSGYTANGLQNINKASDIKSKTAANILASRGLSFSPSSGQALLNPESDRLAQTSSFLSTIPLLKRQFQQQNLSQLMSAFGIMPKGSTSTSTSTTTGPPGNPVAGGISGGAQGLFAALPYLNGSFGGPKGSGDNTVNAALAGNPLD